MGGNGWMKKLRGVALAAAIWTGAVSGYAPSAAAAAPGEQLYEVFSLINRLHFSGMSDEKLRDAAVRGMLLALDDPYTEYYAPEAWRDLQNSFNQHYVGIGIQFIENAQGLFVRKVYAKSAAESAGIRQGDTIVGVGGINIGGKAFEEIADRLLGAEGTTVRLDILPSDGGPKKQLLITRKPFHIPSVEYGRLEGGIGYIRITSFAEDTPDDFAAALSSLRRSPLKGLIIDLRGNPGGYLTAVAGIAENFIRNGALLHTINRDGERESIEISRGRSVPLPISVLVDGDSASASEVLAGALQDYDLATVIGTKTFGKGSVQQLVELQTGGGLRITVEHYLTPNGHPVNDVGITPDIVAEGPMRQTITALRSLDVHSFRIRIGDYETQVNGIVFDHIVPMFREQGKTYVPAVLVADLLNGNAVWDDETGGVSITTERQSVPFRAESGLKLKDGKSYLSLDAIVRSFPGMKASTTKEDIMLELNADG